MIIFACDVDCLVHSSMHLLGVSTNTILLLRRGPRDEGPEGGVNEMPDRVIVVELVAKPEQHDVEVAAAAAEHHIAAKFSSSPISSGLVATVGSFGLLLSSNLR